MRARPRPQIPALLPLAVLPFEVCCGGNPGSNVEQRREEDSPAVQARLPEAADLKAINQQRAFLQETQEDTHPSNKGQQTQDLHDHGNNRSSQHHPRRPHVDMIRPRPLANTVRLRQHDIPRRESYGRCMRKDTDDGNCDRERHDADEHAAEIWRGAGFSLGFADLAVGGRMMLVGHHVLA